MLDSRRLFGSDPRHLRGWTQNTAQIQILHQFDLFIYNIYIFNVWCAVLEAFMVGVARAAGVGAIDDVDVHTVTSRDEAKANRWGVGVNLAYVLNIH